MLVKKFLSTLSILLILAACSDSSDDQIEKSAVERQVLDVSVGDWVVMGSSSAAGAGASRYANSWAGQLTAQRNLLGYQLHNIAKGGATTFAALPEGHSLAYPEGSNRSVDSTMNISAALNRKPSLVVISFPSNDAVVGYTASRSLANFIAMSDALRAEGSAVLVLDTQPRSDRNRNQVHLELSDKLREYFGPCFVPLYSELAQEEALNPDFDLGDGVHLNNAGHNLIFNALVQRLNGGDCVIITG